MGQCCVQFARLTLILLFVFPVLGLGRSAPFPLEVGNWWSYASKQAPDELIQMRIAGADWFDAQEVIIFKNHFMFDSLVYRESEPGKIWQRIGGVDYVAPELPESVQCRHDHRL